MEKKKQEMVKQKTKGKDLKVETGKELIKTIEQLQQSFNQKTLVTLLVSSKGIQIVAATTKKFELEENDDEEPEFSFNSIHKLKHSSRVLKNPKFNYIS